MTTGARWDLDLKYTAADGANAFVLELKTAFTAHVTGVFGPSGCGKTTLLEVLLGLREPRRLGGHAAVSGRTLFDATRGESLAPGSRGLGWVPQDGALFPHLRVRDNLTFAAPRGAAPAPDVVALLELEPLLDRLPHELSGGERQRVAIGRALHRRCDALLLDEPLASLDRARRERLLAYVHRVARELQVALVYVSHDWAEVTALCDHVLMLDGGRLVAEGPPASLRP